MLLKQWQRLVQVVAVAVIEGHTPLQALVAATSGLGQGRQRDGVEKCAGSAASCSSKRSRGYGEKLRVGRGRRHPMVGKDHARHSP